MLCGWVPSNAPEMLVKLHSHQCATSPSHLLTSSLLCIRTLHVSPLPGVQGLQLPSASALQQHYLEGMGLIPSHHPTISPRAARQAAVAAAAGGARAGSNTSAGAQTIKRPEQQLSKDYSSLQHTSDWLEMDLTGAPVSELRLGGQAAGSGDSGSSSNSVPPIEAEVLDAVLRSHLRSVVPYLQVGLAWVGLWEEGTAPA